MTLVVLTAVVFFAAGWLTHAGLSRWADPTGPSVDRRALDQLGRLHGQQPPSTSRHWQ